MTDVVEKVWAVDTDGLKANPKTFTKRDGLRKAQLEAEAMKRFDPKDTDSSLEMVHLTSFYPLLANGIAEAEGFALPLTEEAFWGLPEHFVFELVEAIKEVNPQYAVPFGALQQIMWNNFQKSTEAQPDSTSPSAETAKIT